LLRFWATKIGDGLIIIFLVTLGTSSLTSLIPGDPTAFILGDNPSPQAIAILHKQYGLNEPFWPRYWLWIRHAFEGNLGTSILTNQSVTHTLQTHVPVTLEIAIITLILSLVIAVPLALLCAARAEGRLDRTITAISSALLSIPSFVACTVLAVLVAKEIKVLPTFGWVYFTTDPVQNLRHAALPVIVLVLAVAPLFLRVLRADLVAVLREDFVLAARARGMSDRYIMIRHALRPASFSLFTLTGLVFGFLVGGSIILETYFSIPGIGQIVGQAVQGKDLGVIQGVVVVMSIAYLVLNTLIDFSYRFIDPQSRAQR